MDSATAHPDRLPAGRHGLPREFVARSQRTRIIDAMAHVVVRKGFASMTVADILAQAGVSRRTFYEHYRSKQHCFVEAINEVVTGLVARVEAAYDGPEPWPERFSRALATLLDIVHREPDLAQMCLVESIGAGSEAYGIYGNMLDRFESFFDEAMLEDRRGAGQIETLPKAVVTGICGVLFRYLVEDRSAEIPALLPHLAYFAQAPFLGPEAAAHSATRAIRPA